MMDKKAIGKAIKHTQSVLNALNPGKRNQMRRISDEVELSQYIQELEEKIKETHKSSTAN